MAALRLLRFSAPPRFRLRSFFLLLGACAALVVAQPLRVEPFWRIPLWLLCAFACFLSAAFSASYARRAPVQMPAGARLSQAVPAPGRVRTPRAVRAGTRAWTAHKTSAEPPAPSAPPGRRICRSRCAPLLRIQRLTAGFFRHGLVFGGRLLRSLAVRSPSRLYILQKRVNVVPSGVFRRNFLSGLH